MLSVSGFCTACVTSESLVQSSELTKQIKTDVARAESYFEHAATKHMLSVSYSYQ